MCASVIAIGLSAIGGLCELAGLALVALDIRHDRQQAKRLFVPRPRRERPRRSYPAKASHARSTSLLGGVSYGGQSDQRRIAEALARSVSAIDTAAYNALIEMRKTLDRELDRAADDLRTEIAESDDQLREHLRYVLAGSIADRLKGAILLGAGIVFSMAGSVVGTLS